jgi:hypothetical protein
LVGLGTVTGDRDWARGRGSARRAHIPRRVAQARLTIDRTIDMIKLVGLCDVPRLYLQCARLAAKVFTAIEWSDG